MAEVPHEQLLAYLFAQFPAETEELVCSAGWTIPDLASSNAQQSVLKRHQEDRRLACIIFLAKSVYARVTYEPALSHLKSLLQAVGVTPPPHKPRPAPRDCFLTTLPAPTDYIKTRFKQEKAKFEKTKEVYRRIEELQAEEVKNRALIDEKYQEKLKRIEADRRQRLESLKKSAEEHENKRAKRLAAKKTIAQNTLMQCLEYGNKLEARIKSLHEQLQTKKLLHLNAEQQKIKETLQAKAKKEELEQISDEAQAQIALEELNKLTDKHQTRVSKHKHLLQTTTTHAHDHCTHVKQVRAHLLEQEELHSSLSLQKAFEKSIKSQKALKAKLKLQNSKAEKIKSSLEQRFERQSHSVKRQQPSPLCLRRMSSIDKPSIYFAPTPKPAAKPPHPPQDLFKLKEKVLLKHMQLAQVAETLKKQRSELAYQKRISNFELQRIRSQRNTPLKH